MSEPNGSERRKSPRKANASEMEFILYMDAFKAKTLDVSDHGIRFETEEPILIQLSATIEGQKVLRNARLVWAERQDHGGVRYGFEFVTDEE